MSMNYQPGNLNVRARPSIVGGGLNAFRYANSNVLVVQQPSTSAHKNENWQYSRRA
jgi:hypothetical protein